MREVATVETRSSTIKRIAKRKSFIEDDIKVLKDLSEIILVDTQLEMFEILK